MNDRALNDVEGAGLESVVELLEYLAFLRWKRQRDGVWCSAMRKIIV